MTGNELSCEVGDQPSRRGWYRGPDDQPAGTPNALNLDVKRRLANIVEELAADPTVRVVVLTGAQGVFVAGTDIAEMAAMTPTEHSLRETDRMFTVLRRFPKTLIAAVEGYALGGGCELALACDMIVAGGKAKFGQPEIRVGIMPGAGGTSAPAAHGRQVQGHETDPDG